MDVRMTTRLKDGREMTLLSVASPAPSDTEQMRDLLGHKGEPWVWQIRQCLDGLTPGLDTFFYIARVDEILVGNVTVFRNGDIACIAHVYTDPNYRRLGIARVLLDAATDAFADTHGRLIVLGTGYDSMPWHLYESCGFRGTCPEQRYGGMARFFTDDSWQTFQNGPVGDIRPAAWRHFMGMQVLFGAPGDIQLRSLLLPSIGPRLVEGQFILLQWRLSQGEAIAAHVIEGPGATVLGCAVLGRHPFWGERARRNVLDLYALPSAYAAVPQLIAAITREHDEPLECWCDIRADALIALLKDSGFRQEAELRSALQFGHASGDVALLIRE